MTITSLPAAPARSDPPAEFITKADAFVVALAQLVTEVNAATLALNLNATSDTSSTSNSIGTGAKTFTVSASKSWLGGMFIVIADTAAPSTNSMIAQVTSYNSGTGALVVDVKATLGSGTFISWIISQTTNPIPINNSVATAALQDGAVSTIKLADGAFNGLTTVILDPAADFVAIADGSDAGKNKKALVPTASQTVKGLIEIATSAETTTGTDQTLAMTPGLADYHPAIAKAWVSFNATGVPAIADSYNVSSLTDNGVGDITVNLSITLSSANMAVGGWARDTVNNFPTISGATVSGPTTTSVRCRISNGANTSLDAVYNSIIIMGRK